MEWRRKMLDAGPNWIYHSFLSVLIDVASAGSLFFMMSDVAVKVSIHSVHRFSVSDGGWATVRDHFRDLMGGADVTLTAPSGIRIPPIISVHYCSSVASRAAAQVLVACTTEISA